MAKKNLVLSISRVPDKLSTTGYRYSLKYGDYTIETSVIIDDLVAKAIYLYFNEGKLLDDSLYSCAIKIASVVSDYEYYIKLCSK